MSAAAAVRSAAVPLERGPADYDALLDLIGNARLVLLGEASHGTLIWGMPAPRRWVRKGS